MSRPLKLKVTGAVCCRLSNSPTSGYRAVCGGAPQTFSLILPMRGVEHDLSSSERNIWFAVTQAQFRVLRFLCFVVLCCLPSNALLAHDRDWEGVRRNFE